MNCPNSDVYYLLYFMLLYAYSSSPAIDGLKYVLNHHHHHDWFSWFTNSAANKIHYILNLRYSLLLHIVGVISLKWIKLKYWKHAYETHTTERGSLESKPNKSTCNSVINQWRPKYTINFLFLAEFGRSLIEKSAAIEILDIYASS